LEGGEGEEPITGRGEGGKAKYWSEEKDEKGALSDLAGAAAV
jgi:hypothetical protein